MSHESHNVSIPSFVHGHNFETTWGHFEAVQTVQHLEYLILRRHFSVPKRYHVRQEVDA